LNYQVDGFPPWRNYAQDLGLNDRAFEWSPILVPGNDSGNQLLVD
jgi:hypothetical protein